MSEETKTTDYCQVIEVSECSMKDACKFVQQLQTDLDAANSRVKELGERIIKALNIIKIEKEKMGYAANDSCLLLIEKTLEGGSNEKR